MKTGVILFAYKSDDGTRSVVEWYAERLREKGHIDVNTAFFSGEPGIVETLKKMNVHGMNNTFVVIPMVLSEGDLTVHRMPEQMGMPDNSCSYTYITGTHIAIRFSTTIGGSEALSRTLLNRLKEVSASTSDGVLILAHGSRLSMKSSDVKKQADHLSKNGFPNTEYALMEHSDYTIESAMDSLIKNGAKRIIVLPLFLSKSKESIEPLIPKSAVPMVLTNCIGTDENILEEIDQKIPEGW